MKETAIDFSSILSQQNLFLNNVQLAEVRVLHLLMIANC